MIRLFIKTVLLALLLLIVSLLGYYYGYDILQKRHLQNVESILTNGSLSIIEQQLAKRPEAQWQSYINQLQKQVSLPIDLSTIKTTKLPPVEKQRLIAGHTIFIFGKDWYFLFYGEPAQTAYKRIAKTDKVIAIQSEMSINSLIKIAMRLMCQLIINKLNATTPPNYQHTMQNISTQYGMPIKLYPTDTKSLPHNILKQLEIYQTAFQYPKEGSDIDHVYLALPQINRIVGIGPMNYVALSQQYSVGMRNYFISYFIFVLFIVCLLTWAFGRNVKKLFTITQRYGQGKFDTPTHIGKLSILHSTYQNITKMGTQINQLIKSQTNMSRFVAHEIRTPLYTMQLTLDNLKDDKSLPNSTLKHIDSLYEEIDHLNQLVVQFLLFSQSSNHELKPYKELLDINIWLSDIINKLPPTKLNINYQASKSVIMYQFDPKLLRHAIDNVLTNAFKYAKNKIEITLKKDNDHIIIIVDDDGPGIDNETKKHVFNAFTTLDNDTSLTKHIGLGLAITKKIIDLHGGDILVETSPHHGCRFVITLQ